MYPKATHERDGQVREGDEQQHCRFHARISSRPDLRPISPFLHELTDIIRSHSTLHTHDPHPDCLPMYALTREEDEDSDERRRVQPKRERDPLLGLPSFDLPITVRRRRVEDSELAEERGG